MDDGFFRTSKGEWEIRKDPDAVLPYVFDWTDWLGADTLDSAQIIIADSATLALVGGYVIVDNTKVQITLTGGAARDRAKITCRILTTGGDIDDRSFYVRIAER